MLFYKSSHASQINAEIALKCLTWLLRLYLCISIYMHIFPYNSILLTRSLPPHTPHTPYLTHPMPPLNLHVIHINSASISVIISTYQESTIQRFYYIYSVFTGSRVVWQDLQSLTAHFSRMLRLPFRLPDDDHTSKQGTSSGGQPPDHPQRPLWKRW